MDRMSVSVYEGNRNMDADMRDSGASRVGRSTKFLHSLA